MSRRPEELLREEIERLLGESGRFRQTVELLASQVQLLRARLAASGGLPPEVLSFERLESRRLPKLDARRLSGRGAGGGAGRDWEPPFGAALAPLDPVPGLRCLTAHRAPVRVGFTLFGLGAAEVETAVGTVEERQLRARDFIPVFVTDTGELGAFRLRGYVCEQLPESLTRAALRDETARRYLLERLALIRAKWGLKTLAALGVDPARKPARRPAKSAREPGARHERRPARRR